MNLSGIAERQLQLKSRDCAPNTVLKYRGYWKKILAILDDPKIESLTAFDLDGLYLRLQDAGINQNSIYQMHLLIHNALEIAYRSRKIAENPANYTCPPKQRLTVMPGLDSRDFAKIQRILPSLPVKWKLITLILAYTGKRRGEVAALKFENIDWKKQQILFNCSVQADCERGIYEKNTKSGTHVIDVMPAFIMQLLWDFCSDNHITAGYIFRNKLQPNLAIRPDSITRYFIRIGKKLGFNCSPHRFRHMVATVLIRAGAADWEISSKLGHKDISVTRRIYIHVPREPIVRLTQLLEDAYQQHLTSS